MGFASPLPRGRGVELLLDDLLWFNGITLNTPLRDIGWSYVVILVLVFAALRLLGKAFGIWSNDV